MSDTRDLLYDQVVAAGLQVMDEAEWVASKDWWRMACHLLWRNSVRYDRALHLFCFGAARAGWTGYAPLVRRIFMLGEALCDHIPIPDELWEEVATAGTADPSFQELPYEALVKLAGRTTYRRLDGPDSRLAVANVGILKEHEEGPDPGWRAAVLRDLVPNPFREPPKFDDGWLYAHDAAVYRLAQDIHYDYRFDRLPELADALERAGCTDPDILAHCRSPGPHVRGCWVVDGLLRPGDDPLPRLLLGPRVPGDRLVQYLVSDPKDPFALYRG